MSFVDHNNRISRHTDESKCDIVQTSNFSTTNLDNNGSTKISRNNIPSVKYNILVSGVDKASNLILYPT